MPLCPPQPVKWYLVFPRSLHWMHGQRLHCLKLPLQQLVLLYTFFSVVTMQCPLVRMNYMYTMHVISLKDAPIAVRPNKSIPFKVLNQTNTISILSNQDDVKSAFLGMSLCQSKTSKCLLYFIMGIACCWICYNHASRLWYFSSLQ